MKTTLFALVASLLLPASVKANDVEAFVAALRDVRPSGYARTQSADRGAVLTPDGHRVLVNKPQEDGRWTITLDLDRVDILGNVVGTDGSVTFLRCPVTSITDPTHPRNAIFYVDCFVGLIGTDQWVALGSFAIPGAFFVP